MKLYEKLKDILDLEDKSKTWTVIEQAERMDPDFICTLLGEPDIRAFFFQEIIVNQQPIVSFQLKKFIQFIQHEKQLTHYQNKLVQQRNAVELVWPHKDCLLEGGQTVEEASRSEVFFNRELDGEEILLLLEPKVLTNGKHFSGEGEQKITGLNRDAELNKNRGLPEDTITDNLIIKGDNLLALHGLKKEFRGKIKFIYIDVPYNTSNSGFQYNDRFSHAAWLGFMQDRLAIAKELLAEEGMIFVHIDCSRNSSIGSPELPYLHILLDEIFGRNNFIGHLHWKKKKQPSFLSRIAGIMESILVYSNDEKEVSRLQLGKTSDTTIRIDNRSNKLSERVLRSGIRFKGETDCTIKKGHYKNKTMETEFLDDVVIKNGRTVNEIRVKAQFRNKQSEITRFCQEDLIFITKNNSLRRDKSETERNKKKTITDLLLDWGQNQDATAELRALFGEKTFATPKPELLLHNLISVATNKGDLILDFFLGSGTTAAVAHKMGRQYIGIEQMDYIETVALERLKKVIKGEQGGVSELTDWQGGGAFIYFELKQYNQIFVQKIQEANKKEALLLIWENMKQRSLLIHNVDIKALDIDIQDFNKDGGFHHLSLEEQKNILLEILYKNVLYMSKSSLEDEEFACTEDEKILTRAFYRLEERE